MQRSRPSRWLVLAGAALVIGGLAVWERVSRGVDPVAVATERRDRLRTARARVDACLETQDRITLRFDALTARTDSLRAEVDWVESLDPRGVPGAFYPQYLDLVGEFNAAVADWERESTDLVETADACRQLVSEHNALADSLQQYLVETGIWAEDWIEPRLDAPAEDGSGPGGLPAAPGNEEGPPAVPEGLPEASVPED